MVRGGHDYEEWSERCITAGYEDGEGAKAKEGGHLKKMEKARKQILP